MSAARNNFVERCLAAGLGVEAWRLAAALDLHILGFWDKQAKAYKTEAFLGEDLLRATARLDGRSFARARDELIEKDCLGFELGTRGRGHSSHWMPNTTPLENPAQERGFSGEPENPATGA